MIDDDSMVALSAAFEKSQESKDSAVLLGRCASPSEETAGPLRTAGMLMNDLRNGNVDMHKAILLLHALENPSLAATSTLDTEVDVALRNGIVIPNSKSLISEIIHILDRKLWPRPRVSAVHIALPAMPAMPAMPLQKEEQTFIDAPSLRIHTQHHPRGRNGR